MSKIDEEFWSDKEVKPEWAKDNHAPVIKRSELPGPWEVQPTDELFEPKVKIDLRTAREALAQTVAPCRSERYPNSLGDGYAQIFDEVIRPILPTNRTPPNQGLSYVLANASGTETENVQPLIDGAKAFLNCEDSGCTHCPDGRTTKDSNPKDAFGTQKLQLNVVPGSFAAYTSLALLEGALKYGRYNWRIKGVRVSIYLDALKRHIEKYEEGQWADPKTTVPHLANAAACLCIILDAGLAGMLTDDRPPSLPNHDQWIDGMTDIVMHLKKTFQDHDPYQYTIADTLPVKRALNSEETCPKQ